MSRMLLSTSISSTFTSLTKAVRGSSRTEAVISETREASDEVNFTFLTGGFAVPRATSEANLPGPKRLLVAVISNEFPFTCIVSFLTMISTFRRNASEKLMAVSDTGRLINPLDALLSSCCSTRSTPTLVHRIRGSSDRGFSRCRLRSLKP